MNVNPQTQTARELQENESLSQVDFPPQSTLLKENTKLKQLIIVHSGEVALYDTIRNLYISVFPASNVILGFSYLLNHAETPFRVITTKPSKISAFPVSHSKGIQGLILNKLNIGIMALNSVYKESQILLHHFNKLQNYYKNLKNFLILLSICYYKFQPEIINNLKEDQSPDKNLNFIKKEIDKLIETNSVIPELITRNWLEQNYRKEIEFDFEADIENINFEFDFLKRFSGLNVEIQANLFKNDITILEFLLKKYYQIQSTLLHNIRELSFNIKDNLKILRDENYSFTEKFLILIDLYKKGELNTAEKEIFDVLSFFSEKTNEIIQNHQKNFYKKIEGINLNPILEFLNELKSTELPTEQNQQNEKIEISDESTHVFSELKDSVTKVLSYAEIAKEEIQLFMKNIEALRKLSNPLDSEPEIRKLKRPVNDIFWKAYEKCYLKYHYAKGNIPVYIQLFLLYGYIDENFLEKDQLIQLYQLGDTTKSLIKDVSTVNSIEWLNLIAQKKELPSITELGESYFDTIKSAFPQSKFKKISEVPPDIDSLERRVNHEIKNFLAPNSKLTSGSPMSYFPVLTKFHITSPKLENLLLTKEVVSKKLQEILDIDYSAFYREIVLNDEKRKIFKEFVMVNVLPHIILVPSIGTKGMMWQELEDPRKKESRARIALPVLCTGDLFTMLAEAIGAFRWEIQKTILGHEYNNIGIPSLTSEFIDYIQFYHKNRELSDEQKEKIKQDFKNLRDDRSKFVNDYLIWIKYESQGILKLNKVVRNIMYRYVPFSKKIRDNLSKQPAYAEIHNRFKNIRNKKILELENRWKKYGEKSMWPESLKTTLEYYSV